MNPNDGTHYFHFTLGPVQAFVAQARRTRDFWAGSFILSWLSSIAILAVQHQAGDAAIRFPIPDEDFLKALRNEGTKKPKQGNVPNRFMAVVGKDFEPDLVTKAVKDAWTALADKVWTEDFRAADYPAQAKRIWDDQISGFWDMQWAIVDDEAATNTLDRMKNWRSHLPPDQPGLKCMMMDGWQELSGEERPSRGGRNAFREKLRDAAPKGIQSDLRDGEMLCAIAYVKRRFVRYFEGFSCKIEVGENQKLAVHGWELPSGVPSVHYLAAAHWLEKLIRLANTDSKLEDDLWAFHKKARALTGEYGEWDSNVKCIRDAVLNKAQHRWEALNGEVFFESMLNNPRLWRNDPKDEATPEQAKALAGQLAQLRKMADLGPVTPFYAVLLMDGDELGINMSEPGNQTPISNALAAFTTRVPTIVEDRSGFLVYAGGDDVLAILPMEDALDCAAELRRCYLECFETTPLKDKTSLSGAIEYAHAKMPLGKVLSDAHKLLDDIAKEGRGRDAIACRVWKPGGLAVEWAMPWALAKPGAEVEIARLADTFQLAKPGDAREFANKFFYRLRAQFESGLDDETTNKVLAMEYLTSGSAPKDWNMERAEQHIAPLLAQCRMRKRDKDTNPNQWSEVKTTDAAAMLVRFLAQKGVGR